MARAMDSLESCAPRALTVPGAAKFVNEVVHNDSFVDMASLLPLPGRRYPLASLCDGNGSKLPSEFDWAVSIGAAEHLNMPCVGAFLQNLQRSQKGVRWPTPLTHACMWTATRATYYVCCWQVILAWGLVRNANDTCCDAPSQREEATIYSAMTLLNFRRLQEVKFVASTARQAELRVTVWKRAIPARELAQASIARCNGTTDGAFQVADTDWPLRDHFLDRTPQQPLHTHRQREK